MRTSFSALSRVLALEPDWHLQHVRMSRNGQALELLVGRMRKQSNWLGQTRWEPVEGPRHVWRHLDFGGLPTYVHAVLDDDPLLFEQPWAAHLEQHFSRAMASHLVELLCSGAELGAICRLQHIELDALWRFRFALDRKTASLLEPTALDRLRQHEALLRQRAQARETHLAVLVPAAASPVWLQLASGEAPLDTQVFALRLLLARLRTELALANDPEVRLLKCAKLHRYFTNNANQLCAYLDQINGFET